LLSISDPSTLRDELRVIRSHYNSVRLSRSPGLVPPLAVNSDALLRPPPTRVKRRDRLGGVLQEYEAVAA
jgi:hypothetical protein